MIHRVNVTLSDPKCGGNKACEIVEFGSSQLLFCTELRIYLCP